MTIDISKFWLGMNNDWLLQNTDTSYPRYNIVENTSTGNFRIEVAVPGWSKKELELVHEDNELFIKGKKERKLSSPPALFSLDETQDIVDLFLPGLGIPVMTLVFPVPSPGR